MKTNLLVVLLLSASCASNSENNYFVTLDNQLIKQQVSEYLAYNKDDLREGSIPVVRVDSIDQKRGFTVTIKQVDYLSAIESYPPCSYTLVDGYLVLLYKNNCTTTGDKRVFFVQLTKQLVRNDISGEHKDQSPINSNHEERTFTSPTGI
jgi:hypothetical protein